MSAERELLQRVFDTQHTLSVQIAYEIEDLLAQPEQPERWSDLNRQQVYEKGWRAGHEGKLLTQPEQEPVAWMCNLLGDVVTYKPNVNNGYTPLYAASSKREALSREEIWLGVKNERAISHSSFTLGVKFAEKEHGIGESDER